MAIVGWGERKKNEGNSFRSRFLFQWEQRSVRHFTAKSSNINLIINRIDYELIDFRLNIQ